MVHKYKIRTNLERIISEGPAGGKNALDSPNSVHCNKTPGLLQQCIVSNHHYDHSVGACEPKVNSIMFKRSLTLVKNIFTWILFFSLSWHGLWS